MQPLHLWAPHTNHTPLIQFPRMTPKASRGSDTGAHSNCNAHSQLCHSPLVDGSRSKDSDSDPREEKAESTDDTPESRLSLLDDWSLHSEELRLSSSGPCRVCEIPESSWDRSSERLQSLSKGGAEARLRRVAPGMACGHTGQSEVGLCLPHEEQGGSAGCLAQEEGDKDLRGARKCRGTGKILHLRH